MLPQTITEKYIKNMNWRDFELFVAKVLTWNDYNTIVTPPSKYHALRRHCERKRISAIIRVETTT